jgi:hypothetical protein
MTIGHRCTAATILVMALSACGASPPPAVPTGTPSEAGIASVVEEARTVAQQVEQRSLQIDVSLRDPFSPP